MLRARLPLAVALLAATVIIPATAASAGGSTTSPGTTVVQDATGGGTATKSNSAATNAGTTNSGTSGGGTSSNLAAANPLAGTPLAPIGALLTPPSDGSTPNVSGTLTTFGTCLSTAGSSTTAGQKCVENFFTALGIPGANCFSKSGFTVDDAVAQIKTALAGGSASLTPAALQENLTTLGDKVTSLVTCLTATPTTEAPSSQAPVDNGAAASAAPDTSTQAPAAVAVTGTPNFTG